MLIPLLEWLFIVSALGLGLVVTCALLAIVVGFPVWLAYGLYCALRRLFVGPKEPSHNVLPLVPRLPAEVRARVMARDNFTCQECGATEDLTVDHIKPRAHGGTNDWENLWTLCRHCNSRKGTRLVS